MDTKRLREHATGFAGRFFYDSERGDIGYVAKKCDDRQCDCERKLNSDGDQDCSVALFDDAGNVDDIGDPIVEMLNAVGPLLDRIDALEANAVRMREYRFALEGIETNGAGTPLERK